MIKIKDSVDGKFYFVAVAKNGEPLATSETYETKQGAIDGAGALKKVLRSRSCVIVDATASALDLLF